MTLRSANLSLFLPQSVLKDLFNLKELREPCSLFRQFTLGLDGSSLSGLSVNRKGFVRFLFEILKHYCKEGSLNAR